MDRDGPRQRLHGTGRGNSEEVTAPKSVGRARDDARARLRAAPEWAGRRTARGEGRPLSPVDGVLSEWVLPSEFPAVTRAQWRSGAGAFVRERLNATISRAYTPHVHVLLHRNPQRNNTAYSRCVRRIYATAIDTASLSSAWCSWKETLEVAMTPSCGLMHASMSSQSNGEEPPI